MENTKVALVTGASRGIGAATARILAREGYQLALHYRSEEALAAELSAFLPGSAIFQADLSVENDLVERVKAKFGRIDLLVNNAGRSIDQLITFAKPADFATLLDTNLKSVFALTKIASKIMIKQKSGSIINITSIVGFTGNGGQSMYAATKGALTAFTKSIAIDLAPFGIRANAVAPGFIGTDMTRALPPDVQAKLLEKIPLKKLGTPEDIGEAVAFLASEKAAYITGSTLHVNGGMFPN